MTAEADGEVIGTMVAEVHPSHLEVTQCAVRSPDAYPALIDHLIAKLTPDGLSGALVHVPLDPAMKPLAVALRERGFQMVDLDATGGAENVVYSYSRRAPPRPPGAPPPVEPPAAA